MKEKKIINFKDWALGYLAVEKTKDWLALLMYCLLHKKHNIIVCNVNSIPDSFTVDDVAHLLNGDYIQINN